MKKQTKENIEQKSINEITFYTACLNQEINDKGEVIIING